MREGFRRPPPFSRRIRASGLLFAKDRVALRRPAEHFSRPAIVPIPLIGREPAVLPLATRNKTLCPFFVRPDERRDETSGAPRVSYTRVQSGIFRSSRRVRLSRASPPNSIVPMCVRACVPACSPRHIAYMSVHRDRTASSHFSAFSAVLLPWAAIINPCSVTFHAFTIFWSDENIVLYVRRRRGIFFSSPINKMRLPVAPPRYITLILR